MTIRFINGCTGVACVALAGCVSMRVNVDYDPQASFDALTAYQWMDSAEVSEHLADISPFLERRLRRAVDGRLQDLGYRETDRDPDFMVTAFVLAPDGSAANRCPDRVSCMPFPRAFSFELLYPYAFGFRYPWYHYRFPYRRSPWGYAYSYRIGFGYTWIPVYDRPSDRLSGTIIVDVYNRDGELIWRGSAEGALYGMRGADVTQEYLDGVVLEILQSFPPD